MSKILVSGATGFIGRHLIEQLLDYDVEIIATSVETKDQLNKIEWLDRVHYLQYDLNSNNSGLFEFFAKPDQIIHLAWEGLPHYTQQFHLEKNLPLNFQFLKTLALEGLKKISVIGSCFEYGMQEGALNEEMETYPSNPYGKAKDLLRKQLQELKIELGFDFNWYRLFYVYGKGQNPNSLLSSLETALKNNASSFNMSPGDQIRDFIPIEEAVDIIARLSLKETECGIVNCCSGIPVTVKDKVNEYLLERGKSIKLNLGHYPYSKLEPFAFWGDTTKLNKVLKEK